MSQEMRDVRCGVGDRDRAWLEFETRLGSGSAAIQVVEWEDAKTVIEDAGVRDVADLNGKPCLVEVNGGFIKFIKVLSI